MVNIQNSKSLLTKQCPHKKQTRCVSYIVYEWYLISFLINNILHNLHFVFFRDMPFPAVTICPETKTPWLAYQHILNQ